MYTYIYMIYIYIYIYIYVVYILYLYICSIYIISIYIVYIDTHIHAFMIKVKSGCIEGYREIHSYHSFPPKTELCSLYVHIRCFLLLN